MMSCLFLSVAIFRLAQLKSRIRAARMKAPLFDTQLYTHHLEELYKVMWDRYEKSLPADHIQAKSS